MVDAYAVVFAGLLLSLGALGDRVGRKWVFMGGLVVFGAGSAFAAWSGSPDRLTLARAVMGVGAAALMPCTLSILTNIFTAERDRARAIGIWSGTTGIGVALGPILGGVLAGPLLVGFGLPGQRSRRPVRAHRRHLADTQLEEPASTRPDPVGRHPVHPRARPAAVGDHRGTGTGLDLSAHRGLPGRRARWSSSSFVVWERRIDHPMLPLRFFGNRRYSVAIAALALVLFALLGMFFLMTQYLQFVLGYSALEAGIRIAPVALALLVIAPFSVVAARRIGTKVVVASGLVLIALGLGLLSRTTVSGDLPRLHRPVPHRRRRRGARPGAVHGVGDGVASQRGGRRRFGHQRHRHAGRWRARGRGPRHRPQPPLPAPDGPGDRPCRRARLRPGSHPELGGCRPGRGRAHPGKVGDELALLARTRSSLRWTSPW